MSQKVYDQWKPTRLLEGIDDEKVAMNTAILLENQRRYNEQEESMDPFFKRSSIPFIRRVFPNLYCGAESRLVDKFTEQATLDVNWLPAKCQLDDHGFSNLDEEARIVANTSVKLCDAINAFVYGHPSHASKFYVEGLGVKDGKIVLFYGLE